MSEASDKRCRNCQGLAHSLWPFGTNIREIRTSAGRGCLSCTVILRVILLRAEGRLPRESLDSEENSIRVDPPMTHFRLSLDFNQAKEQSREDWIELFRLPGKDHAFLICRLQRSENSLGTETPWSGILASNHVSADTSSPSSIRKAKAWLHDCLSDHRSCAMRRTHLESLPPTPKRVIDVRGLDADGSVQLVEYALGMSSYMCLSHCWGTERVLSTTKSNIAQHNTRIDWSKTPQTFRDAINVTREIGQRYLWIDSLCIVQDDLEDWNWHAEHMCDIYQNSYLTLAAAVASDSKQGLFHCSTAYCSVPISIDISGQQTCTIYARKAIPHWFPAGPTPRFADSVWFRYSLEELFPLATRGWVLQERILSPRTLYFGSGELVWECCEELLCECLEGNCSLLAANRKRSYIRTLEERDENELRAFWHYVVYEFSGLGLTYRSDCFHALQGIAADLLRGQSYKIISGLWGDNLGLDLLWKGRGRVGDFINHLEPWQGPSWSWIGLGRPILIFSDMSDTILRARIDSVRLCEDQNPGKAIVVGSELCIQTKVLRGTLTYRAPLTTDPDNKFEFEKAEFVSRMRFDSSMQFVPDDLGQQKFAPKWSTHVDRFVCFPGAYHIASGSVIYSALIATLHRPNSAFEGAALNGPEEVAYLLRPIDEKLEKFERVGLLGTYPEFDQGKTPLTPPEKPNFAPQALRDEHLSTQLSSWWEQAETKSIVLV